MKTIWGTPTSGNLISSIFDLGVLRGVSLNNIIWQGSLNGGVVRFQIASSDNQNGPWNFVGPDGTGATYYGGGANGPNTSIAVTVPDHNNRRYLRYHVFLNTNAGGTQSPIINDIILGYSL